MRVNLTIALGLSGETSATGLQGPVLHGIEASAESDAIAAFAGMLAGLSADPESEAGPMAAPISLDPEASDPEAAIALPSLPETADGKMLPDMSGKILPELQLPPAAPVVTDAEQAVTVKLTHSGEVIARETDKPRDPNNVPVKPEGARAPEERNVPAEPLRLQVTAQTVAPMQAREPHSLPTTPTPPTRVLLSIASKLGDEAPASDPPQKADAAKEAKPPVRIDPTSATGNTGNAADGEPEPKSAKPQASPTLSNPQPVTSATVTPVSLVAPTIGPEPASGAVRAAADIQPQDFDAIVQRLTEARESARSGETSLRILTREFGHVAMQFETAGRALKVSLASQDIDFAPAVQAALAERGPLVVSEAGRAEAMPGRGEQGRGEHGRGEQGAHSQSGQQTHQNAPASQTGAQSSAQGGGQSGGQNNTQQGSNQSASAQTRQSSPNTQENDRQNAASARDNGLFA